MGQKLDGPIYWNPKLILNLKNYLNVDDSIKISECIYILERKGEIQKSYLDNQRILISEKYSEILQNESLVTFIMVNDKLYVRRDDLDSWTIHEDWVLRLKD